MDALRVAGKVGLDHIERLAQPCGKLYSMLYSLVNYKGDRQTLEKSTMSYFLVLFRCFLSQS